MTVPVPPDPLDGNGCSSCAPGHNLDGLQPRLDADLFAVPTEVVSVMDSGMVFLFVDGTTEAWWTHDPDHARALLKALGPTGDLHCDHGVISFPVSGASGHALAVVPIEHATPCTPIATAEQFTLDGWREPGDGREFRLDSEDLGLELNTLIAA